MPEKIKNTSPETSPLPVFTDGIQSIALSFSGGGFRAAAFSLGCASYLKHLKYKKEPLLHKVKFISSASGGSITNLLICSMLRRGSSFEEIYEFQKARMNGTGLMDEVFNVLEDNSFWNDRPDKSRNLINAFAIVYDRDLFNHATFKSLHQTPEKGGFAIADTCINATEFANGMNFRWETNGKLGNNYLFFDPKRKAADRIKLGDILASSSCLPGGFEPIMFPRDFSWSDLSTSELNHDINEINYYNNKETAASKADKETEFALMDGGIDDNQGIYAFELADDRKQGRYDLYFPCDVTSNFMGSPYSYPADIDKPELEQSGSAFLRDLGNKVKLYFMGNVIALLVFSGLALIKSIQPYMLTVCGFLLASIALPILIAAYAKRRLNKLITSIFPNIGSSGSWGVIFDKYKDRLLSLPLKILLTMLIARATSVALLALTLFLKRIRQISYKLLYANKANEVYGKLIDQNNELPGKIFKGKLWREHIGVTTVYQLSTKNDFMLKKTLMNTTLKSQVISPEDRRSVSEVLYPVGQTLQDVANIATDMETTLWFDPTQVEKKSMESLIATGQATMCFNLIVMACQFGNSDHAWLEMKAQLIHDWETFKKTPYHLV